MAASNLNKTLNKPYVYDLLGRLNASFGRVIRNLAELENVGAFEIYKMRRLHHQSRELQADANFHLLETLRAIEEKDWSKHGRRTRPPASK